MYYDYTELIFVIMLLFTLLFAVVVTVVPPVFLAGTLPAPMVALATLSTRNMSAYVHLVGVVWSANVNIICIISFWTDQIERIQ